MAKAIRKMNEGVKLISCYILYECLLTLKYKIYSALGVLANNLWFSDNWFAFNKLGQESKAFVNHFVDLLILNHLSAGESRLNDVYEGLGLLEFGAQYFKPGHFCHHSLSFSYLSGYRWVLCLLDSLRYEWLPLDSTGLGVVRSFWLGPYLIRK